MREPGWRYISANRMSRRRLGRQIFRQQKTLATRARRLLGLMTGEGRQSLGPGLAPLHSVSQCANLFHSSRAGDTWTRATRGSVWNALRSAPCPGGFGRATRPALSARRRLAWRRRQIGRLARRASDEAAAARRDCSDTNRVLSRSDRQVGYSVAAQQRVTAANVAPGFSCMRLF